MSGRGVEVQWAESSNTLGRTNRRLAGPALLFLAVASAERRTDRLIFILIMRAKLSGADVTLQSVCLYVHAKPNKMLSYRRETALQGAL